MKLETIAEAGYVDTIHKRLKHGDYQEPNVEPGMLAFAYDETTRKKFQGVVEKVVYTGNNPGNPLWSVYLQGVGSRFEPSFIEPIRMTENVPRIRAHEVYEIKVQHPAKLPKKILLKLRGLQQNPERIKARVITQSGIAADALVYLISLDGQYLYAARATDLEQRQRSDRYYAKQIISDFLHPS